MMEPHPDNARAAATSVGPMVAVGGAIGFAALSPISYAAAQISCGIALAGLLAGFATRGIRYRPTPLDLPLLLFIGAELLSIIFSVHPARSLRCLRGDWILLFYPVLAQSLRKSRDVRRAFQALVLTSSIVAVYAFWQMLVGRDLLRDRSLEPIGDWYIATGLYGHHLTYGGHVLITATLALSLWGMPACRREAIGFTSAVAAQILGLLASFARTAWIGFVAAICGMAVAAHGRLRAVAAALVVVGVAAAAMLPPIRERFGDVFSFHDDPRVRLWETALRIWRAHPICGAGLGSFKTQFPLYKVPGTYMATGHPHNDALNILVASGILGIVAFALIWVRYFRYLHGALRLLKVDDPRQALLLAATLAPVALFVGGIGQCFLTDEEVGTLFWFVAACGIAVAREVRDERA